MSTLELEHLKHTSSSSNNLSVHSDGTVVSNNKLGIGAVPNATFGSLLYAQGTPAANKPIISGYSQGNSNNAGLALFNDTGNRGIWTTGSTMRFTRSYEGNSTTDMNIDADGVINMPSQPSAFFQGNDASWGTINAGNVLNRAFTTSGNGAHAHSSITYNQSNGRFTIAKAGKYFVSFAFYVDAAANNDMRIILRQNGGGIAFNHYDFVSSQSTISNSSAACLNIAANDYIDFYTPYQISNYGGPQHSFVSIFKVA